MQYMKICLTVLDVAPWSEPTLTPMTIKLLPTATVRGSTIPL